MIKFFRRIRQKLLTQNKLSQYLIYAIGEIILVVIGILIALQINNWNELKKNNNKEFYLLKQLQKEFEKDSSLIETQAWLTNLKVEDGRKIKHALERKLDIPADSLVSLLFYNSKALLFQSNTPTYDEIISSGNLSLIKSESLKANISNYKSSIRAINSFLFMEAHGHKEKYNTHLYKYFDAEIMTHLWRNNNRKNRIISSSSLNNYKADISSFMNDPNSIYHVSTLIGVDAELNFQYSERLNKRIYKILDEIRAELKKFNN